MKIKIDPYTKSLFLQNTIYIVIAIVLLISIFIIPPLLIGGYTKNAENIFKLEEDIKEANSKKQALSFISDSKIQDINEYYNTVTAIIPETENYFSIIYSLNRLSELTNFNITSYSINLKSSTDNKVSIDVRGVGNQNQFLEFLKEYNFGGGRLITAEKISLNQKEFSGITLRLNFYNKPAGLTQRGNIDYQEVLSTIDQIKEKVRFTIQSEEAGEGVSEEINTDYPTKTNPF
ncbi:MAG: hypothetical protein WEC80_01305 [Patescibacteria group bacterium]